MDEIARTSAVERNDLFRETANAKALHFQIIEKDFWVCWTLKRLFNIPEFGTELIFKGGTSLSKVYRVIERFSEDIDIAINRDFLGFGDEKEMQSLSSNKRNQAIKELDNQCKEFVQADVYQSLQESLKIELGEESERNWTLSIDPGDTYGQTLLFAYPRDTSTSPDGELSYVKPVVRIEMGARPTNEPAQNHQIQSYASEEFPQVFASPAFELKVLEAKRTFWEKATILHDLHHRNDEYKTAERASRHYYDLYKLSKSQFAEESLSDRDLLRRVIQNKKIFFSRAGANYDDAANGSIRLIPSEQRINALKRDYREMEIMMFTTPPSFDEILSSLSALEETINS